LRSSGRDSTQASRDRIIDGHMHEIPTRAAVAATRPPAAGTVAGPVEAPELLDIEMEQPAGACPCGQRRTGAGGSSRPSRLGPAPPPPARASVQRSNGQDPACARSPPRSGAGCAADAGHHRYHAIRQAAGGWRPVARAGALARLASAARPPALNRATHLRTVRNDTPNASPTSRAVCPDAIRTTIRS
jgi:hypothetical protein